jgi:hypothetical protein
VKELIHYLLNNLYLDFQGDVTLDVVHKMLRSDSSPSAQALLKKIAGDSGVEDLLITLADCLKENLATGITEKTVQEQLNVYSES